MVAAVLHLNEGARPAFHAVDPVRHDRRRRHDVADGDFSRVRQQGPACGAKLLLITQHAIDLRHGGEALRVGLRRAAGDHDPRVGPLAPVPPDGLTRLPHRLGRDRAGVHHDRIVGSVRRAPDHLRLGGVEPAAECDDLGAHRVALPVRVPGAAQR
jgi:hypothetical protein